MFEIIAVFARWFQLAANLIILGSCVFLVIAGADKQFYSAQWVEKLEKLFPKLVISIVIGLVIVLAATIQQVVGDIEQLLQTQVWIDFISGTRAGQIWMGHVAAAILLALTIIYLRKNEKVRARYFLCALIATLPLIADAMSSHSTVEGLTVSNILPYALHIIFAGIWFGGLPALLLLKYEYVQQTKNSKTNYLDVQILKRFSTMAMPVMLLIVINWFNCK